jgi:hypothetical protein
MVSDASPRPTNPKMNKLLAHTADMSSNHACTQDAEYFKRPHQTIIDGDMRSDSGWFLVGFWVVGHLTRD